MANKPRCQEPYPPGWPKLVTHDADFEGAFKALEGYEHFHTETLRGMVRRLQLRLKEAWRHFDNAEALLKKAKPSLEYARHVFFLRLYASDAAILEEALDPCPRTSERTDLAMVRFTALDDPDEPVFDQIRIVQIAYYKILRGDYDTALETFEFLIEKTRSQGVLPKEGLPRASFFCGAAAAAKELGLEERAEWHYENVALGLNMLDIPFLVGVLAGRLYTLMMHWNRPQEAKEWMFRLEQLDCPEGSRRSFIKRAEILTAASARKEHIFIS